MVITCCCAWALLLAVSRLGFQSMMTVPDSCGSLRCGTRTCTQGKCIVNFNFKLQSAVSHLHGLFAEGQGALLEHEDPLNDGATWSGVARPHHAAAKQLLGQLAGAGEGGAPVRDVLPLLGRQLGVRRARHLHPPIVPPPELQNCSILFDCNGKFWKTLHNNSPAPTGRRRKGRHPRDC